MQSDGIAGRVERETRSAGLGAEVRSRFAADESAELPVIVDPITKARLDEDAGAEFGSGLAVAPLLEGGAPPIMTDGEGFHLGGLVVVKLEDHSCGKHEIERTILIDQRGADGQSEHVIPEAGVYEVVEVRRVGGDQLRSDGADGGNVWNEGARAIARASSRSRSADSMLSLISLARLSSASPISGKANLLSTQSVNPKTASVQIIRPNSATFNQRRGDLPLLIDQHIKRIKADNAHSFTGTPISLDVNLRGGT